MRAQPGAPKSHSVHVHTKLISNFICESIHTYTYAYHKNLHITIDKLEGAATGNAGNCGERGIGLEVKPTHSP